jgi:pyruvate/2-oxoglutarate dehydrogenase complex dihydrolipoamide dehydrogenase (E3) component
MKTEINSEIVIIGSGPSGLRAAFTAINNNLTPIIFDWNSYLGGILRLLGKEIKEPTEARIFTNTTVININYNHRGNHKLIAVRKGEIINVNTKQIIIATGSRDITAAGAKISGSRPAGIFTATEALRLLAEGYLPGKKVVILGGNEISIMLSKLLISKGVQVTLVTPKTKIENITGVQLIQGYTITHVKGKERVEKVKLALSDENFTPIKDDREYECDTLIVSIGFKPLNILLNNIPITIDILTGGPVVNERLEALPGINVVGGSLAPFEALKNVEQTGNIIFREITRESFINIKPGANVKFLVPQKIIGSEQATLFYSTRPGFQKLKLVEYNIEIPINETEGFVEINTTQFKKNATITIDAVK